MKHKNQPKKDNDEWMVKLHKIAYRYGVEEIDNAEYIYAIEARDARNETPEQVAKYLWGWKGERP